MKSFVKTLFNLFIDQFIGVAIKQCKSMIFSVNHSGTEYILIKEGKKIEIFC